MITEFARNMRKIQDNKIELLETSNTPHDNFAAGQVLGLWRKQRPDGRCSKFSEEHGKR